MLNALSVVLGEGGAAAARAAASMRQQGFLPVLRLDWDGGVAEAWENPLQSDGDRLVVSRESVICDSVSRESAAACCIGPIWYDGEYGKAALHRLLDEVLAVEQEQGGGGECRVGPQTSEGAAGPPIDESRLRGNFVLLLRAGARVWLLNDALGFARVYQSSDRRFFSTSWLAARAWEGSDALNDAAAIQYVLLGAAHSIQSPAQGVSRLALGEGVDLATGRLFRRPIGWAWPDDADPASGLIEAGGEGVGGFETAVEQITSHLRTVFGEIATAFSGRTAAALSGGFDSRLIVAALVAVGERPRLFVYGSADNDDVRIAQAVAQAAGIGIDVIDKAALDGGRPSPDLDALVNAALFFDGLPNDGIHDPGADRQTRLAQTADGAIALNGGGGEIFRNFFHLPERSYRPIDIVRAFYRGFDGGVFRRPGGLADYEAGVAREIAAVLGLPAEAATARLPRAAIERVYPLFRCHHWMAVNNSLSLRTGHFATPLVDPWLVGLSARLPLAWKNAGRLQSRLIAAMHPGIAAQRSGYGFAFDRGPDDRARRAESLACLRPVWARPHINGLRRRLHRLRASQAFVARCRSMLPGEWQLDPWLDLDRLPDDESFARALSIELVWRALRP